MFHAATSRLFLIPTFLLNSFFNRPKAIRRKAAMLASAWSFRTRLRSSPKLMSNCQGSEFSIPQWPRTAAPKLRALIYLAAHDVDADLITRLAASHRVADRHADPLQPGPPA